MSDQAAEPDETAPAQDDTTTDLERGFPAWGEDPQRVLFVPRENLVELANELRSDGYWMCVDLCGVDYLLNFERPLPSAVVGERFEVVISLLDHRHHRRLRLRVQVPEDDPTIPSLMPVWPSVDFPERELWDFFGIHPDGHPRVDRILMPDSWEGHPLRKDYDVGEIPVQFKEA